MSIFSLMCYVVRSTHFWNVWEYFLIFNCDRTKPEMILLWCFGTSSIMKLLFLSVIAFIEKGCPNWDLFSLLHFRKDVSGNHTMRSFYHHVFNLQVVLCSSFVLIYTFSDWMVQNLVIFFEKNLVDLFGVLLFYSL